MSPALIRPARLPDAAAIAAIYNQGIEARRSTFETRLRTVADIEAWLGPDARYPVLVAERDGRLLGWANLSAYRPRECYAGIAEFSIYLDGVARGQRLGRRLMQALIERARGDGFHKLVSRIFPDNAASLALCRRCGFREVGRYLRHARLDGEWRDVVIVERGLLDDSVATPSAGAVPAAEAQAGDLCLQTGMNEGGRT